MVTDEPDDAVGKDGESLTVGGTALPAPGGEGFFRGKARFAAFFALLPAAFVAFFTLFPTVVFLGLLLAAFAGFFALFLTRFAGFLALLLAIFVPFLLRMP